MNGVQNYIALHSGVFVPVYVILSCCYVTIVFVLGPPIQKLLSHKSMTKSRIRGTHSPEWSAI